MAPLYQKYLNSFSGKNLFYAIAILAGSLLFSACEDDPILNTATDEDCVGSYCLLAEPTGENHHLEITENPEEF